MALCEKSFKRLRGTHLPSSELKSIDTRHRIIWKLFANIRYESDAAKKWVPKFQSLIRMRQSRRRWQKVFRARRLLLSEAKSGTPSSGHEKPKLGIRTSGGAASGKIRTPKSSAKEERAHPKLPPKTPTRGVRK
jgi:hypothetical protein